MASFQAGRVESVARRERSGVGPAVARAPVTYSSMAWAGSLLFS